MENTVSYTKEELLKIKGDPPIEGFREFWMKQYDAARAWNGSYHIEDELWSPEPACRIYRIRFTSTDGFSIGIWISRPAESIGGHLMIHGYGHVPTPPVTAPRDRTIVHPCLRGLGLSQCRKIPWESGEHAAYGFDDPENYVITGGVRDLWISLSILIDMFPDTAENILCSGISLGGGMGALAIPWDDRIHYGELDIPSLGGRIALDIPAIPGTARHTRNSLATASGKGMRIIDLCNASSAAGAIRVPTLITPALMDETVPPPEQFAVANSIPEKYRIMRIKDVGHADPTERDMALEKELAEIRSGFAAHCI